VPATAGRIREIDETAAPQGVAGASTASRSEQAPVEMALDLDAGSGFHPVLMTTTQAIEIAGLTKSYGDHAVLRGVDFDVAAGSIFALLGSNGAGKTTVVRILATLLRAEDVFLAIVGHDPGTETVPDGSAAAGAARTARG
jgi:ABC-type molybdenum transport system ATPase subunit/photorepair protein PhrA